MLLSKCTKCDSKKSKLIKQQEASGLLSSLGIKKPLSKIKLNTPFCFDNIKQVDKRYKMKVNLFLLAEDKFMPEMHLRFL